MMPRPGVILSNSTRSKDCRWMQSTARSLLLTSVMSNVPVERKKWIASGSCRPETKTRAVGYE